MLVDSLKFAREKQVASGALPVAGFERLRDSLFDVPPDSGAGKLFYEVKGGADARDNPVLQLRVSGRLPLQCQRCLKVLDYALAIDTTLRLVAEAALEAEMSDDPEEPDCVAASTAFDLVALIEDEVLLALPAYPRHEESESSCVGSEAGAGTKRDSAFSVLSKLGTLKQ